MAQHTIHALQSELDSLRADNIKLFEKIKFLQNYPGRVGALPFQARGKVIQAGGAGTVACWAALGHPPPEAIQRPLPPTVGP